MQQPFAIEQTPERTDSPEKVSLVPDFNTPIKPIADFVNRPDFPLCALGEFVDIGGYAGVVMEIVKLSLKVISEDGTHMSYNANGLRKIYGAKARPPETETPSAPEPDPIEPAAPLAQPSVERSQTETSISENTEEAEQPNTNAIAPDFNRPIQPIVDFAGRADFPQCTLGEYLNIGGYAGVVAEIVKQSLKVRSPEGTTMSFNANGLRKLYAPKTRADFDDTSEMPVRSVSLEAPTETAPSTPQPTIITNPDFNQPMKAIRVFAGRRDFPECALGQYVDIRGYSGVVVEIKDDTLEVQTPDGATRSYGAVGLRKLFS